MRLATVKKLMIYLMFASKMYILLDEYVTCSVTILELVYVSKQACLSFIWPKLQRRFTMIVLYKNVLISKSE